MRLLSRYLFRQLAAPFAFALTALTSLMLLGQIAKKFGSLVGKGLPWTVIAEVFGLSIPFIVAMTLPMAVLVAVLYAFSHLAADNEITAMRASGISVYEVLIPVLAWGALMTGFNFAFVDQVVPRSNAQLRSLYIDIGRKKPTLELREQVINEIPPSEYYLRATRIDPAGRLKGVTIYDAGGEASRRVIYADSGIMAYGGNQTDLTLRLFDGSIHQYRPTQPEVFQLTYFRVNDVRVKNAYDELQRSTSDAVRGDREMSTCEMLTVIRGADQEKAEAARDRREFLRNDLRALLTLPALPAGGAVEPPRGLPRYCHWIESVEDLLLPRTAQARSPDETDVVPDAEIPVLPKTAETQGAAQPSPRPIPSRPGNVSRAGGRVQLSNWSQIATAIDRAEDAQSRADRYLVEVHKKWAISFACISFVIIGIVMALRFPRGGIGLVIGGGLLVFSIHYIGLTAGESLADRGIIQPWLAMWLPNIVLTVLGLIGLVRVSRESGSTRGGDFQEVVEGVRHLLRRTRRLLLRGTPAR